MQQRYKVDGITYDNILLDDGNADWYAKTVECMDRLADMLIGQKLLTDVQIAQHTVEIFPSSKDKNECKTVGPNQNERFVTLRQAFNSGQGIQDALVQALSRATKAGLSLDFIASQLAQGLSPATIHTDKNVGRPSTTPRFEALERFGGAKLTREERELRALELLDDLISGKAKWITNDPPRLLPAAYPGAKTEKAHTIADDLVRILKPWCEPGQGCKTQIYFTPYKTSACALDPSGTSRPPAIGLAHELCHAWRNVMGVRFFDDAIGIARDDDEVMTTGFPPYNNEPVSENMFRAQWAGETLKMRTDYDTYTTEAKMKKQILSQRH